jgi:hypothetical protein
MGPFVMVSNVSPIGVRVLIVRPANFVGEVRALIHVLK